jgi:DNA-binding NtrC family response regulator
MNLNVVYIDDEAELLQIFEDCYGSEEINIKTFSNPSEGIEEILRSPPDLIILDFRLPNTTGDEIALKLGPSIPKVLISGELFPELKAPFLEVLTKPIKFDVVDSFLQSRLQYKREKLAP